MISVIRYIALFLVAILFVTSDAIAQEEPQILLRHEQSGYLKAHTQGFGFGFRKGKYLTGYRMWIWEAEFTTLRHPKEVRTTNAAFPNTATYYYGKLNRIYLLKGGVGIQKLLTEKPIWGGVQVRQISSAGVSLAIAEPIYLYILYYSPEIQDFIKISEKYDPEKHYIDNIYSRGPFGEGLFESKLYPGIYFKTGLSFEYGEEREFIRALEAGFAFDAYLQKIPIMAFDKNSRFYLTFYLSFHIGKRME